MTRTEVANMIASLKLPYAYYQFPKGTAQACPFVCFFYTNTHDVYADDSNYQRITGLSIELYTSKKDFALEDTVEQMLKNNGFTYYKEENYIDTEKMWQIAYEMEVLING